MTALMLELNIVIWIWWYNKSITQQERLNRLTAKKDHFVWSCIQLQSDMRDVGENYSLLELFIKSKLIEVMKIKVIYFIGINGSYGCTYQLEEALLGCHCRFFRINQMFWMRLLTLPMFERVHLHLGHQRVLTCFQIFESTFNIFLKIQKKRAPFIHLTPNWAKECDYWTFSNLNLNT